MVTFAEIFGERYEALAAFGKPLMLAEFGSLAVGGDRAAWYSGALADLPVKHPAVKAVLFFEVAHDQTVTYQSLDWTVAGDTTVARAIRAAAQPWAPGLAARDSVLSRR